MAGTWVHDTFPALGPFAWQEGYGVFSVSKSLEDSVKKHLASGGHRGAFPLA
jgi:hypothetical protein